MTSNGSVRRRLVWAAMVCAAACGLLCEWAPAAEAAKAKRQTWDEMMTVDRTTPVEDLAAPADADARRKAFAERNSPENVEKLAKQLFAMWDFGEGRPSRNPVTQRLAAEKSQLVNLYNDKKYDEALKAYRDYLTHKVQLLWYTKPSFYSGSFEQRFISKVMRQRYDDFVPMLMRGEYQTSITKTTVRLGEPGLMHWEWKPKEVQNLWDNSKRPEIEYFCGSEYDKLWWKFIDTRDRKYLDRWVALMDDYCQNHHLQEDLSALNLDLGKQGMGDTMGFLLALCEISRAVPEGEETIPAAAVARMMVRQVGIVVPQSLFYNRQQSNNHSPGTVGALMRVSEFLFDFRIARTIEMEGRRQFENYGTLEARPDGAGPGRLPNYAMFEFKENQPFLEKARVEDFDWYTPQLSREWRDRMLLRGRYMIHMHSPTGELIVTQKTDRHMGPFDDLVRYFNMTLPELFDEPAILRITNRILRNQTRPGWDGRVYIPRERPVANMGMGTAADEAPTYTSYSYPFDRIHVLSSGWDPKVSQYGVLLGSTVRGYGDSFMKENKAANHFNLSAFDRDLFCNGVDYAYNYLSSPVLVDGQQQFNGAGEGPTSRRGGGNYGLDPICQDRIYYSADLDVVEGFYDGAYVNTGDHNPEYYDYKAKLDALARSIRGVSHRRVIHFVKQHGLWIVTDLMKSDPPHEYAQQWWLWKQNKEAPDGFLEEQIQNSQDSQTIKSKVADRPNFSMYHVGPAELDKPAPAAAGGRLRYDPVGLKPEWVDKFTGTRGDRLEGREFIQLRGSWKSPGGRSQLVTVIYPRKAEKDELVSLTPLKRPDGQVNGFTAKLPNGTVIGYAASLDKPEQMKVGNMQAVAESLLVVQKPDGSRNGAALACMQLGADRPKSAPADYAFAVGDDGMKLNWIHRPIEPVVIGPERNVFVDQLAVTLETPTVGTDIRYTVDGSDPTLASRVYENPLVFTSSVVVKARAFRRDLKQRPPPTPTGTEMTGVSMAVFTKEDYHEPATWAKDPKAGLNFEYFEAKWVQLLFGPHAGQTPLRRGSAAGLFDTSAKGDNKDRAFAFVYDGYLDVPADGVYTIHTPPEFRNYRPLAGYDLSLWLGYRNTYHDGKLQAVSGGTQRNLWYPATRRHAFGTWSLALRKGLHPIRVYYADIRPGASLQYLQYEYPGWNVPGLTKIVWDGDVPQLEISGPDMKKQPIPKEWFKHD